jgi:ATPase subunit of ABC transporter with duplicated ATPase domains
VTLNGVAARAPDGHTLFDNLTLAFGRERTGVVGRNGVGKTTLLRLIAGLAEPQEGTASRAGRIGWLDQRNTPGPDETVADALGAAEGLAALDRVLAGVGSEADLTDADWTLEARLDQALAEVGLSGLAIDRAVASLSGGEQTRLRLARLLLDQPDLLVLDEPTNHLDADARRLVADFLECWPGGVVVVSHDRALLRRMDRIVELSALGVSVHGGNYDLYAERKAIDRVAAERGLEAAEREVGQAARVNQRAAERKARRDRAGKASRIGSSDPKILLDFRAERAEASGGRERRLAERRTAEAGQALEAAREQVERVRALSIPMPSAGLPSGRTVLEMVEATWDAPSGRRIIGPISLTLTGPERLAVTGPNGAGKSTLLRLMSGELAPSTGRVDRPVAASRLDQSADVLQPDQTLTENYRRLNPEASSNSARAALARFLFRNVAADRVVSELSGGERLRAALACVMTGASPPQLLILDEPTNHLDLDSIAAVEAALTAYDGALVVVSHDEEFLLNIGVTRTLALT